LSCNFARKPTRNRWICESAKLAATNNNDKKDLLEENKKPTIIPKLS
jgi:hypothetical protein